MDSSEPEKPMTGEDQVSVKETQTDSHAQANETPILEESSSPTELVVAKSENQGDSKLVLSDADELDSIGAHVLISEDEPADDSDTSRNLPVDTKDTSDESIPEHTHPFFADPVRAKLYEIIFEADTAGGRAFDVALLIAILVSVIAVMLDSVNSIKAKFGDELFAVELVITILFTAEYILRLYCSPNRKRYVTSFFGVIDLLAIIPTYIEMLVPGGRYLMVVRVLRLLRLFRIFKLGRFLAEAETLTRGIKASLPKIIVFLFAVVSCTTIVGAAMYLIEGEANGFTSIPQSVYWAIVTLTTVGYGDIAPKTVLGQILACTVMILGYGVIAVPTGIVSVELHKASRKVVEALSCSNCGAKNHTDDAKYCRKCGNRLTVLTYVKEG